MRTNNETEKEEMGRNREAAGKSKHEGQDDGENRELFSRLACITPGA